MSCKTDINYGYGFAVGASDENLKEFLSKHREALLDPRIVKGKELLEYLDNTRNFNPKEDFFDWECYNNGMEGFLGVIADIMTVETGIRFSYEPAQEEAGSEDYIMLVQVMPWYYNDTERNLTEDDLKAICSKYIAELCSYGERIPGYVEQEYFG